MRIYRILAISPLNLLSIQHSSEGQLSGALAVRLMESCEKLEKWFGQVLHRKFYGSFLCEITFPPPTSSANILRPISEPRPCSKPIITVRIGGTANWEPPELTPDRESNLSLSLGSWRLVSSPSHLWWEISRFVLLASPTLTREMCQRRRSGRRRHGSRQCVTEL